jgi:hypothetical protein
MPSDEEILNLWRCKFFFLLFYRLPSNSNLSHTHRLLNEGASIYIKDDRGLSVKDVALHSLELLGLLKKRDRKLRLRGTSKKTRRVVNHLGKRITTVTPIHHDMWLISLDTMLTLYGKLGHGRVMVSSLTFSLSLSLQHSKTKHDNVLLVSFFSSL